MRAVRFLVSLGLVAAVVVPIAAPGSAVQGGVTPAGDAPSWLTAVGWRGAGGQEFFGCSAPLIAPDWVLVTHTCIGEMPPGDLFVINPARTLTVTTRIGVDRVIDAGNDLRLLRLVAHLDDIPALPTATASPPVGAPARAYFYDLRPGMGGGNVRVSETITTCSGSNPYPTVCAQSSDAILDTEIGGPLVYDTATGPVLAGILRVPGNGGVDKFTSAADARALIATIVGALPTYGSPSAPSLTASQSASALYEFTLQWTASDGRGWPLDGYDLITSTELQLPDGSWTAPAQSYVRGYAPGVTSALFMNPLGPNNQRVRYAIEVHNEVGRMRSEFVGPFLIPAEQPLAQPAGVVVTPGAGQVTIGWNAPADVSRILRYHAWATVGFSSTQLALHEIPANATAFTMAVPLGNVVVHLAAWGWRGFSPDAIVPVTVPGPAGPAAPSVIADAAAPPGIARVTWTPVGAVTSITGWEVAWENGPGYSPFSQVQILAASARQAEIARPAGEWVASVRALGPTVGLPGRASIVVIEPNQSVFAPPLAPGSISVTPAPNQATVTWGIAEGREGAPVTGYRVTAFPVWPSASTPVTHTVAANTLSTTFNPLTGASRWHFQVRAISLGGLGHQVRSGPFWLVSGPQPPPPPSVPVVAVNEGDNGTVQATIHMEAITNTLGAASIPWYTELSGTAAPDVDYQVATGTGTVTANDPTFKVKVKGIGDKIVEPDEYFYVVFQPPVGIGLEFDRVKILLVNDD